MTSSFVLPRSSAAVTCAFVVLWLVAGCTAPGDATLTPDVHYAKAVAAAAAPAGDQDHALRTIDVTQKTVTVVTLKDKPMVNLDKRPIWVSLPDELRSFCRTRPDALLAMQQALGLPPDVATPHYAILLDVKPTDLFRPCASGHDITQRQCEAKWPDERDPRNAEVEHFVLWQLMTSYRGTGQKYPFTAMGWTYDWNPQSASHKGVSEFILRKNSFVQNVRVQDPAAFCGSDSTP